MRILIYKIDYGKVRIRFRYKFGGSTVRILQVYNTVKRCGVMHALKPDELVIITYFIGQNKVEPIKMRTYCRLVGFKLNDLTRLNDLR